MINRAASEDAWMDAAIVLAAFALLALVCFGPSYLVPSAGAEDATTTTTTAAAGSRARAVETPRLRAAGKARGKAAIVSTPKKKPRRRPGRPSRVAGGDMFESALAP